MSMSKYLTVEIARPHRGYPCNHAERVECLTKGLLSWGWVQEAPDGYGRLILSFENHTICMGKRLLILKTTGNLAREKRISWQTVRGEKDMRSLFDDVEIFIYRLG